MVLGAAIGAAAAPIIGGAIGYEQGHEDRRRARVAQERALAAMQGLELPEYDRTMAELPEYSMLNMPDIETADYSGVQQYDPKLLENIQQGSSQMEGISTDPALRAAQMKALDRLSQVGEEGMTAEDKFRLAQSQQETARAERGGREAILQNMQQRGLSGSGMELAAQLQSQQSAAERNRMEALGIEGMAQSRALEGMAQAGQLGGQIRGQEFGEQASVAQAQDAIARFNAQQSSATQAANVAAQNEAQLRAQGLSIDQAREAAAAANQQSMIGMDVTKYQNQMAGQGYQDAMGQKQYQNQLTGQEFDAAARKAGGLSGAYQADAAGHQATAASKGAMFSGVGQGVGQGFATYGASQNKKGG